VGELKSTMRIGKDSGSGRRNERNEGTPGTEDSIRKMYVKQGRR
jgi:hypothetical protein